LSGHWHLAHRLARHLKGSCLSCTRRVKVLLEDYIVVVLGDIGFQSVVLCEEGNQHVGRSVVAKLFRSHSLFLKHHLKQVFAMAATLRIFGYIKVEYAHWLNLPDLSRLVPDKQFPNTCFQDANRSLVLHFYVKFVVAAPKF